MSTTIVVLSDIHGTLTYLPAVANEITQAHGVVIAGDITTFSGVDKAARLLGSIEACNAHIMAVSGNCDSEAIDDYLAQRQMAVNGRCITHAGLNFIGISGVLPRPGATPNAPGEAALTDRLMAGFAQCSVESPLVVVSHQPAYGTRVDGIRGGRFSGSRAIRAFILQYKPILAISGHIHEAIGVDHLEGTILVNPGSFKLGHYAVVEIVDSHVTVDLRQA